MPQYSWDNCPADVCAQVHGLLVELRAILGANLAGTYLHGSLAMGCFHPARSDLDLLVVTGERITPEQRYAVAGALLRSSGAPAPIEISFLSRTQVSPWAHPTPFDLHYSEDWRVKTAEELASGAWRSWGNPEPRDYDLAAHCTVTLARGVTLSGPPPSALLPPVPREDYVDSIIRDVVWAGDRIAEDPVYLVLNTCRVLAYLREGLVLSKDEGGAWGLRALPEEDRPVVAAALAAYRDGTPQLEGVTASALRRFAGELAAGIRREG
ncbi:MAG TPA: aminoglycoside adenylyltransferase domain-containing protein [Roseiflexaceae bacterium]|nr:aminoglycoside adenylyltransferase domain-containing protein [Roseiflexaceae bacterium]